MFAGSKWSLHAKQRRFGDFEQTGECSQGAVKQEKALHGDEL